MTIELVDAQQQDERFCAWCGRSTRMAHISFIGSTLRPDVVACVPCMSDHLLTVKQMEEAVRCTPDPATRRH